MKPNRDPNPSRTNIYTCELCGDHVVSRDVNHGVTPYLIPCQCTPGCSGKMRSHLYRVFDPDSLMKADLEWYKPSLLEIVPAHLSEHVGKGGLLLRKVPNRRPGIGDQLVRHKERGTVYRVIGVATVQSEDWVTDFGNDGSHPADGKAVIIYQGVDDRLWVRPEGEFNDGRFEKVGGWDGS